MMIRFTVQNGKCPVDLLQQEGPHHLVGEGHFRQRQQFAAAAEFFGEDNVPREAITMGVATILDARDIAPMVTWGTNPEHALPVTGVVPSLDGVSADKRADIEAACAIWA